MSYLVWLHFGGLGPRPCPSPSLPRKPSLCVPIRGVRPPCPPASCLGDLGAEQLGVILDTPLGSDSPLSYSCFVLPSLLLFSHPSLTFLQTDSCHFDLLSPSPLPHSAFLPLLLIFPLNCCVILSMLLTLSEPQSSHLWKQVVRLIGLCDALVWIWFLPVSL